MTSSEAGKMAMKVVQDAAFKLSDLIDKYPDDAKVFVLVAMRVFVDGVLPLLDDKDKQIFDLMTKNVTTTVAPRFFDPRKRGGATS